MDAYENHEFVSDIYKHSTGGGNLDADVDAGVISDKTMDIKDRINAAFNMASPTFSNSAPQLTILKAVQTTEQGISVLGKYPDYIHLADKLGARRFSILPDIWNKMTAVEQWAENVKFLDEAIRRGDKIILSNLVSDINQELGLSEKSSNI